MRHNEEGTIREICYTQFDRGFSNKEIIAKFGFHQKTVIGYRYKQKFFTEDLHNASELLDQRDNRTVEIVTPSFSVNEMDYGTDNPVYKWSDLTTQERGLRHELRHKELKCF